MHGKCSWKNPMEKPASSTCTPEGRCLQLHDQCSIQFSKADDMYIYIYIYNSHAGLKNKQCTCIYTISDYNIYMCYTCSLAEFTSESHAKCS